MLILDLREIGNRFLMQRKKSGLTQAELAERAGLSERTYADIERGTANMRVQTFAQICNALNIDANEILTHRIDAEQNTAEEITEKLQTASEKQRQLWLHHILLDLGEL